MKYIVRHTDFVTGKDIYRLFSNYTSAVREFRFWKSTGDTEAKIAQADLW